MDYNAPKCLNSTALNTVYVLYPAIVLPATMILWIVKTLASDVQ